MQPVTIQIKDNSKTIQIPWRTDMNVQEALETAYDQEKAAGQPFDFAVQYFGYSGQVYLGYLVVMIDKIYDNPTDPNDYWWYKVNGKSAQVGIDSFMVNAGDTIEFDYLPFSTSTEEDHQHKTKNAFYKKE